MSVFERFEILVMFLYERQAMFQCMSMVAMQCCRKALKLALQGVVNPEGALLLDTVWYLMGSPEHRDHVTVQLCLSWRRLGFKQATLLEHSTALTQLYFLQF